jgi:EAL domain-containing protein (putative c-di-GMP-specific phosphodiesterase class I)
MYLWRELIKQIITDNDFDIEFINDAYKIEGETNEIVMQEAFTKAKDQENNQIPIGTFVSIAEKYEMIESFDKAVIEKVITYVILNNINHKICINLSIDSIGKKDFIKWLQNRISRNKEIASKLVFSLTAYSVAKDMDIFKNFCDSMHSCGARVIIKRFESKFIPTENLKEFNVDYIRLARDYTSDIEKERSKQDFLDSICDLADLLNIKIFAENVKDKKDLEILKKVKLFAASK